MPARRAPAGVNRDNMPVGAADRISRDPDSVARAEEAEAEEEAANFDLEYASCAVVGQGVGAGSWGSIWRRMPGS